MRGDTPFSMLQSQLGSIWVSSKIADIVRENEIASGTKKSLLYKIIKDKVSLSITTFYFSASTVYRRAVYLHLVVLTKHLLTIKLTPSALVTGNL